MDFLGDSGIGRRRINLGGSSRSGGEAASRQALLDAARREREARHKEKERNQAASKIQSFWRSRHAHARECERQRSVWDAQLASVGAGAPASALRSLTSRFYFFARSTLARSKPLPRLSTQAVAQRTADENRWKALVKLLLASFRATTRAQHLGSLIVDSSASSSASVATVLLPPVQQWVVLMRRVSRLLVERVGRVESVSMDSGLASEVMLLWLLLDCTQWTFVKDASCLPAERAIIQATQAHLLAGLVCQPGQACLPPLPAVPPLAVSSSSSSTRSAAASSSSSFSGKKARSAVPQPAPMIDLFHCIRQRLLSLAFLTADSTAPPTQAAHKASVALLVATMLRAVSLASTPSLPLDVANAVRLSFAFHVLSIPALPQRLRFLQLGALVPGFLTTAVWDCALEQLTDGVRALNAARGTVAAKRSPFAPSNFASQSYSFYDEQLAPAAPTSSPVSGLRHSTSSDMVDAPSASSSPPPTLAYFIDEEREALELEQRKRSMHVSGLAWTLGNLLEFVTSLDETRSDAASRSFSAFLGAVEQLVQAVPAHELPALGPDGGVGVGLAASSSAASSGAGAPNLPPMLSKQLGVMGERAFLDRLCRRLTTPSVTSGESAEGLADVPIVCALVDSMLYRWSDGSGGVLNQLVFRTDLLPRLWTAVQRSGILQRIEDASRGGEVNMSLFSTAASSSSSSSASSSSFSSSAPAAASSSSSSASLPAAPSSLAAIFSDRFFHLLPLFCTLYSHLLLILDDDEFFQKQKPFALSDVASMVAFLKQLCFELYWRAADESNNGASSSAPPPALLVPGGGGGGGGSPVARWKERFGLLFTQLRDRQTRRAFLPPSAWLFGEDSRTAIPVETLAIELEAEETMREELGEEAASMGLRPSRSSALLSSLPFALPFPHRVQLFYAHLQRDRSRTSAIGVHFEHGLGRRVRIRRDHVLEDTFAALAGLPGWQLKGRIQCEFVDFHGLAEAGVDGGGLFKEMMLSLLKQAIEPQQSLFKAAQADQRLYPDPAALTLPTHLRAADAEHTMADESDDSLAADYARERESLFRFLGCMVGKSIYDGLTVEMQFSLFFLRACVGHPNYLDDLATLDREIHSSVLRLKALPDDQVADLGLTFSVDVEEHGRRRTVELMPRGAEVPVTAENRVRFLYLLSDYYLNRQISRQTAAFREGLASLLDTRWLRVFTAEELRLLISGSSSVDVSDWRAHCHYSSGYTANHELIQWFWQVVGEMDEEQLALLLRFTTSCSRAPLLGFKHMAPGFCIQRVNIDEAENLLPTASTCMNLLRLPRYSTKQRLKEKLIYAITAAQQGFGLT